VCLAHTAPTIALEFPDVGISEAWMLTDVSRWLENWSLAESAPAPTPTPLPPQSICETLKSTIEQTFLGAKSFKSSQKAAALAFWVLFSTLRSLAPGGCNDRKDRGWSMCVKSELPVGAGLGSSASFSVCLAASMLNHFGYLTLNEGSSIMSSDLTTINEWALYAEKVIHGNPSGVDNTVGTYGKFRSL
jgi:mevalonate kinase